MNDISQHCHFIGIGGIGMSGLARIMLEKKTLVTGSDIARSYVVEGLEKKGAKIFLGHAPENIRPGCTVIFSTDIKKDNPEYLAACQHGCKLMHRSDLLAELMKGLKGIAVAGTHGKTTTSSLLTFTMRHAGIDPSYAIGGILPQFNANAGSGKGEFFVAEADESDGTFLKYHPYGAIITNIDNDHLDHFKNEETLLSSFTQFVSQVESKKHLFWCGDDPALAGLGIQGWSYGFSSDCDIRILKFKQHAWKISYDLVCQGRIIYAVELPLVGKHNALNSAAVFGLCLELGVAEETIKQAFKEFKGVKRRVENRGEAHGVLFLDDYAHHPTEIKATIKAVKDAVGERRLITIFQPHRYTRTRDCLGMYKGIFDFTDELFVTEIYSAGEQPIEGIDSGKIMRELEPAVFFTPNFINRRDLAGALSAFIRPHDVILTLGAGDITKLPDEMMPLIKLCPPKKYRVGVIFGGKSVEHDVSLMSAKNILASLNTDHYEIQLFGIAKNGVWVNLNDIPQSTIQAEKEPILNPAILEKLLACDIFFPVLHGPNGEDGTIQGLFEMLGKPYVGPCYRASAICMDKIKTKKLAAKEGIPVVPFWDLPLSDWKARRKAILNEITAEKIFPLYVKPNHLGSSLGVSKVEKPEQLEQAIDLAFQVDTHVLIEKGLSIREIECAVLGNADAQVYGPGEVLTNGAFYNYESKYSNKAFQATPCADLPLELAEKGRELALKSYRAVGCSGMARVDFFLDKEGIFWLNEINPIPGFTKNSIYPQACRHHGIDQTQLMDKLIMLGLERGRTRRNLV